MQSEYSVWPHPCQMRHRTMLCENVMYTVHMLHICWRLYPPGCCSHACQLHHSPRIPTPRNHDVVPNLEVLHCVFAYRRAYPRAVCGRPLQHLHVNLLLLPYYFAQLGLRPRRVGLFHLTLALEALQQCYEKRSGLGPKHHVEGAPLIRLTISSI